jgi:hypothetical protein
MVPCRGHTRDAGDSLRTSYLNPTLSSSGARPKVGQLDVWLHKLVREDEVLVHQGGDGSACASHLDVDGGRLSYIRLHRRCCPMHYPKHGKTGEHPPSIGRFPPLRFGDVDDHVLREVEWSVASVHVPLRTSARYINFSEANFIFLSFISSPTAVGFGVVNGAFRERAFRTPRFRGI